MPPSATIVFIAETDPTIAVLAAHLLALASNDRVRTAALSAYGHGEASPVLHGLLGENMMPHWYLPPVHALGAVSAELAGADIAIVLWDDAGGRARAAFPQACLTRWSFPDMPGANVDEMTALFDWRCLYAAVARRMSLLASLSPQALARLTADSPGATLRISGF